MCQTPRRHFFDENFKIWTPKKVDRTPKKFVGPKNLDPKKLKKMAPCELILDPQRSRYRPNLTFQRT
jgi:hypothetical protein